MTPEQARRALELFEQALEVPGAERESWLERTELEPEVAREVASLLAADASLEQAVEATSGGASERSGKRVPERVGAYRLLDRLGEGGMSEVYLAVRDDGELERRAAVKLIKRELLSLDLARRFEVERQILASLDHPAIARLYDAGRTPEGVPYFVMELIEGEPIDSYCDRHRLSVAERLRLFREVCQAVAYAHQNLVVHRDLKPANLFVTRDGQPKLLDFGIAKLLNPTLAARDSLPTQSWQRLATPEYASPEQLAGRPITTASDTYSLGVLLFHLLTGSVPHRLAGLPAGELERRVATTEAELPSARLRRLAKPASAEELKGPALELAAARGCSPRELARQLAGDLDAIVAKALRKEPQNRYVSAEQLADDIGRHLEGLPVLARRGSWRYRFGRLVRRHRLAAGFIAGVAVLLLAAATALGVLSAQLAQQRDLARRERDQARQATAILEGFFQLADPDARQGRALTVDELLDQAAQRVARELENQPEMRAELLTTLGVLNRSQGRFEQSEQALVSALATRRALFGESHPAVADSLLELGQLRQLTGHLEEAETLDRQALALRRKLFGEDHPLVTQGLYFLGSTLLDQSRGPEAEALLRQALERDLRAPAPAPWVDRPALLHRLGDALWDQGKPLEAEPYLRQALQQRLSRLGPDALAVAQSRTTLGLVLQDLGRLDDAEKELREAGRVWLKLLGKRDMSYLVNLNNLAGLATRRRDYAAAAELYREALEAAGEALPPGHPRLAFLLLGLGGSLAELGRTGEGEPFIRRALELRRSTLGADHWLTGWTELVLGGCLGMEGRFAAGEPLVLEGWKVMRSSRPLDDPETARARQRVENFYQTWGRPVPALSP